ncbi:MAG: hypothetical protein WD016_04595 [Balneolaceae bacterium]
MVKIISFLIVMLLFNGCFNGLRCLRFSYAEKEGSYSTNVVPTQYIAIGDTVHFNTNTYWNYRYDCMDYGDDPELSSLIVDSRNVELYNQGNSVFIVGKKLGTYKASIVGSVYLVRDYVSNRYAVPLTFDIVVESERRNNFRQRFTLKNDFKIDTLLIDKRDNDKNIFDLTVQYSPETEAQNITDIQAHWGLYPFLELDSLKQHNFALLAKHDFGNTFFFRPDTLYKFYYTYVHLSVSENNISESFGRTFILDFSEYAD